MEIIKVILTSLLSAAVLFLLAKIMGHKQISQLPLSDSETPKPPEMKRRFTFAPRHGKMEK